jgi:hypothetical protein
MPGSEGVLWWGRSPDRLHGGPPRSLLDRCRVSATCPKVFETFGGSELWNQRMTVGLVTSDLRYDIPLPPEVRRYYFPSTQHGGGIGGFSLHLRHGDMDENNCTMPLNPNPEVDQMHALTIALVEWVSVGKEPPPSAYPSLGDRQLVRDTSGALHFPGTPACPRPMPSRIPFWPTTSERSSITAICLAS